MRMTACVRRVSTGLPANQKEIARHVIPVGGVLDPPPMTWNVTNVRQALCLQAVVKVQRTASVKQNTMDPTVDLAKLAHGISTVQEVLTHTRALITLALQDLVTM